MYRWTSLGKNAVDAINYNQVQMPKILINFCLRQNEMILFFGPPCIMFYSCTKVEFTAVRRVVQPILITLFWRLAMEQRVMVNNTGLSRTGYTVFLLRFHL